MNPYVKAIVSTELTKALDMKPIAVINPPSIVAFLNPSRFVMRLAKGPHNKGTAQNTDPIQAVVLLDFWK
jgi:hypothetical protein